MRTFVAVEITNKEVLESLKQIQTKLKISAKPVKLNNLHFTMFFLGEAKINSTVLS